MFLFLQISSIFFFVVSTTRMDKAAHMAVPVPPTSPGPFLFNLTTHWTPGKFRNACKDMLEEEKDIVS